MNCKECKQVKHKATGVILVMCCAYAACGQLAAAQTVYLVRSVVVTGDQVTLGQLCRFRQLEETVQSQLEGTPVAPAPRPGASMFVTADDVQRALRAVGVNLANVVVTGAARCEVSRPRASGDRRGRPESETSPTGGAAWPPRRGSTEAALLDMVRNTFEEQLRRYGGKAEIRIGRVRRGADKGGSMTHPTGGAHTFSVRVNGDRRLGRMIKVDVDVFADGEKVQTVPLIVSASITRQVVVARRAINLKATVRPDDVALAEQTYDNEAKLPSETMRDVVGLRSKHFIAAGRPIRVADLEAVPLIKRGQLVELVSRSGGIEVRSVAKAMGSGSLGARVELQAGGRRGERVAAIVTGEREAMIGGPAIAGDDTVGRLAWGAVDEG